MSAIDESEITEPGLGIFTRVPLEQDELVLKYMSKELPPGVDAFHQTVAASGVAVDE